MRYAQNNGEKTLAKVSGERAICPTCGGEVIAKCGTQKIWHWAHLHETNCDHKPMTQWHLDWQNYFPKEQQEIPYSHNGRNFRADVVSNGTVIEFQHSSISEADVIAREAAYKDMIWVLDGDVYKVKPILSTLDFDRTDKKLFNLYNNCKDIRKVFKSEEDYKEALYNSSYNSNTLLMPKNYHNRAFFNHTKKTCYVDLGNYLYEVQPDPIKVIVNLNIFYFHNYENLSIEICAPTIEVQEVRIIKRITKTSFLREFEIELKPVTASKKKYSDYPLAIESAYRDYIENINNNEYRMKLISILSANGYSKEKRFEVLKQARVEAMKKGIEKSTIITQSKLF